MFHGEKERVGGLLIRNSRCKRDARSISLPLIGYVSIPVKREDLSLDDDS